MSIEKKELFSAGLRGGIIGTILVLILVVAVIVWIKPFNYRAVLIVEQTQLQNEGRPVLTIPEVDLLASLRDKGYLVTPAEYTNNMIGYYNTLIAFLAVFFVVFTVAGYFAIRGLSKKEVREEARELLKDSESFRSDVMGTLMGNFDANYVQTEVFEQRMKDIEDNVASLLAEKNKPVEEKVKNNRGKKGVNQRTEFVSKTDSNQKKKETEQ